MSFALQCQNCGAPSGPSVGVCPYCKAVMKDEGALQCHGRSLMEFVEQGKLGQALLFAAEIVKSGSPEAADPIFLCGYAELLIETEGSQSSINSLLMRVLLNSPDHSIAKNLLRIMEAKNGLREGVNDRGELVLREILKENPNDILALFTLGSHLFWIEKETNESIRMLEKVVTLKPSFKRAWGCLAAIYKKIGNTINMKRAAERFLLLESDSNMRKFIQEEFAR